MNNPALYEAIDAYVERQIRRLNIPGAALAIVEGDRILHWRGFGQARPGGKAPTLQTPFYIGSLTKSFTALAVMQLVEAGQIELEAPVRRYLPWFQVADPEASSCITVRHLLNQTSGLPTSSGETLLAHFDDSPGAAEQQARALAALKPARPAGSAHEYSNSNYLLLGLIIEAASGETYADYIQGHILNPLHLRHITTSPALARQAGLATGHRYWFAIPFAAPDELLPRSALAGGGLIASAEDMARYLIVHLNGGRWGETRILSDAGMAELHRGAAEVSFQGVALGKYGMGWYADTLGPAEIVWHSGILPHFFAYMALLPGQEKGVVLLINACHHWMSPVLTEVGAGVAALLAGVQPKPAPVPFVNLLPWLLRGQLLIPAIQVAGVAAALRQLGRWRRAPERRPRGAYRWVRHVLVPLIANLLPAAGLRSVLGRRRGYLKAYMPDCSLIAWVCGCFALAWSVVRAALILRALRGRSPF